MLSRSGGSFLPCGDLFQDIDGVKGGNDGDDDGGDGIKQICTLPGKGAERIDNGMGNDAGNQAAGLEEHHRKQEADGGGIADLQQSGKQVRAAQEVDDVADAEGQGGNQDGSLLVLLAHTVEQQSTEDHFLQEANTAHTDDMENAGGNGQIHGHTAPQVGGAKNQQGKEVQVSLPITFEGAQAIVGGKAVFADKAVEDGRQDQGHRGSDQLGECDAVGDVVRVLKEDNVEYDPEDREPDFVFLVQFFHWERPFIAVMVPINTVLRMLVQYASS